MSAQNYQTADAKARAQAQAQATTNQVLSHPYVQKGIAVGNEYVARLDKNLSQYPVLNDIESRTRVPKAYGALGLGAAAIFLIFFNLFGLASPVSNLIGWAVPAYLSIKALESPGKSDDKQWLTYWVVFGLFNFIESAALRPVLYYVPFYFVIKTLFVLYLMNPYYRGAANLYETVVRKVWLSLHSNAKSASYKPSPISGSASGLGVGVHYPAGYTTTTSTLEHEKTL